MGRPKTCFFACRIERRAFVRHATLHMKTGETVDHGGSWTVGACDVPLFDERSRRLGACRSCLAGWEVEENTITDKGRKMLSLALRLVAAEEERER